MPAAATLFFGDPSAELDVIGITGTNGKTTTAYLLHSILVAAGRRPGLLGNIERRVGETVLPAGLNAPEAIDLAVLKLTAQDQFELVGGDGAPPP